MYHIYQFIVRTLCGGTKEKSSILSAIRYQHAVFEITGL